MIKKNEVNKQLIKGLEAMFKRLGFQGNLRRQSFVRNRNGGSDTIHFAYIAVSTGIDIVPDLGIRMNDLEGLIFENTSNYVPEDLKGIKISFGCFLTELMPANNDAWLIADFDDLKPVTDSLSNALSVFGLPFFEKYADAQFVLDLLISNEYLANQLCPIPINRALTTAGLAFLKGNGDQFRQIGDKFLTLLKPIPNSRVELFEEFLANIKSKSGCSVRGC